MQNVTYGTPPEIYIRIATIVGIIIILGFFVWLFYVLEMHPVITGVMTGLVSGFLTFILIRLVTGIDGYRKHRELCEFMIRWRDVYRQHTNWWEMRTRRWLIDEELPHVKSTEDEKKTTLRNMMNRWTHDVNEEYVQTCRYLIASVQALYIPHTQKLEYMSVLCEETCVVREHERDMRRQNMVRDYDEFIYDWFSNKMLVRMGMKNPPVRPEYKMQEDSHD